MDSQEGLSPEKEAALKADLERLKQTYGPDAVKHLLETSASPAQPATELPNADIEEVSTESSEVTDAIRTKFPSVFNESALAKLSEWRSQLDPVSSAEYINDPDRTARLFILKNMREAASNLGLGEIRIAHERDEDKTSDIVVTWDSYNHGHYHARLQLEGLRTVLFIPNAEERNCVNDAIKMRDTFQETGINNLEVYSMADSKIIELPDEPIRPSDQDPDTPAPKTVPLDQQKLSVDTRTGQWYGR